MDSCHTGSKGGLPPSSPSTGHITAAKVRYRRELRASLKIGPTLHMLGTTKCGLNNSQETKNLEGESPLSAVPTATLLRTHASGV
jgi:hypothetical protein